MGNKKEALTSGGWIRAGKEGEREDQDTPYHNTPEEYILVGALEDGCCHKQEVCPVFLKEERLPNRLDNGGFPECDGCFVNDLIECLEEGLLPPTLNIIRERALWIRDEPNRRKQIVGNYFAVTIDDQQRRKESHADKEVD